MTREERENAIRCLKMWIEREPQLQTYRTCLEALEQEPILDKIRAKIEKQEKWLLQAGYTAYNVDIALDAIKHEICKRED